jgi:hypothetical protein
VNHRIYGAGVKAHLVDAVFEKDPQQCRCADMMVNVQKRNLILFLPQHKHDSFDELYESQHDEEPVASCERYEIFQIRSVLSALPSSTEPEAASVTPLHKIHTRSNLKQVVASREAVEIDRLSILHVSWSNVEDEQKINRERQDQRHRRPHQRPRVNDWRCE